ncbi:pentatricopeptide repeat-containing protein At1g02060, chloroplastic [Apium graveolens]|uniref:pentatricopeptide repeat-containing protein At1g02060, chloroplastic n=1 Tax=Apium graveolens TaxID=4045 RepID=UPI003D796D92
MLSRQSPSLFIKHIPISQRTYSSHHLKPATTNNNVVTSKKTSSSSSTKSKTARNIAQLINTHNPTWESSLPSTSLSQTTILRTLRLIKTPSQALHFFIRAHKNGFTHTPQSYFLMLQILSQSRNFNSARNFLFSIEKKSNGTVKIDDKFFNVLIRSYANAGLFSESIKLFNNMKSVGVFPSVITFNSLFVILLRRGRIGMVYEVFDEMLKTYGVTPDNFTFNILIKGFCRNGKVDEGFRFFNEMIKRGCQPDVVTYNTLVDGLCRVGKVKVAHNVVKGMVKKSGDLNLNPNVVTYTTLIRGYCGKHEIDEALDILKEMVDHGLKPNEITYNTLIQGLCGAQKLDKIKEVLEGSLGGSKFVPDTCTFNTLMNAHCSAGNVDEAVKVFEKMAELKVQPDSATYSILIGSFCQKKDYKRSEKLLDELLKKEILLQDGGCKPLVAAYNPIFEYLCSNGKSATADRFFRQLLKRGTQDPSSFKTLIMGHCREGAYNAGYELLVIMLRRDFMPDVEIYESLINGLLQKGEPKLTHDTLEKMLRSSYLPPTPMFHSILTALIKKSCVSESARLVMLMLEKRITPNIGLSTDVVKLLFKNGTRDKATEIVRAVYENGYTLKANELIAYLCQNRRLLEAQETLMLCLAKEQTVDSDTCSTVIAGLCKIRKASEAFKLYYELLEKGVGKSLSCLKDLRDALEAEGRLKEAEFVSLRMPKQ